MATIHKKSECVRVHGKDRQTQRERELDDTQYEGIKNQYVLQRITQNILAAKQKN